MNTLIAALRRRESVDAVATIPLTANQLQSGKYRAHAHDCQRIADRWSNNLVRQQYEELARQWLMLAEQAEKKFQSMIVSR